MLSTLDSALHYNSEIPIIFFLFKIKYSTGICISNLEHFNIMANNTSKMSSNNIFMQKFIFLNKVYCMSGNRSSLKIDMITEDPQIRKLYCNEKSITNNRITGNKSLYNCTKKIVFEL